MATVRKSVSRFSEEANGLTGDFAQLMRAFKEFAGPYRPELHYMRGPGPKWRAKHAPAPSSIDAAAVSGLVRVKG